MENILLIIFWFVAVVAGATSVLWGLIKIATSFGSRGRFVAGALAIIIVLNVAYFAAYG
ncbi:hypothetical protein [Serratia proteamaculans]|uniref:hypothetical protein n=1 Tax=Serratia proteamaculans TaxID=28151 RepID=UPI0021BCFE40|nr:hypothetical protein [Serratia proteamaculans]